MIGLCLLNKQYAWPQVCQKVGDFLSGSDGVEEESVPGAERGNSGEETAGSDVPNAVILSLTSLAPILREFAFHSINSPTSFISFERVFPPTGRGFYLACSLSTTQKVFKDH